ncbi:MAG: hypothetical protein ACUVRE_07875 [Thermoanaerobaculaceae bacterium]
MKRKLKSPRICVPQAARSCAGKLSEAAVVAVVCELWFCHKLAFPT